ncbi:MAG: hypothetical protein Q7U55_04135, partial [Deltaproteobacteria bacterium]|nr:hypothetical protein [Deltaproteobacteria bacterium]
DFQANDGFVFHNYLLSLNFRQNSSQKYSELLASPFVIPAEAGIQDFRCADFSGFPPAQRF